MALARLLLLGLAAALLVGPGSARGEPPDSLMSPRLLALDHDVVGGRPAAVDSFWAEVGRTGAPLMEPCPGCRERDKDLPLALVPAPDSGSVSYRLVTFLWRSRRDTRVVILDAGLAPSINRLTLKRLPGTDVWYRSYRMRADARFLYELSVDDPRYPFVDRDPVAFPGTASGDPLNPRRWELAKPRVLSLLELPEAPPITWSEKRSGVPEGEVAPFPDSLRSDLLGNARRIFYYKPAGYAPRGRRYPLLVFPASYISTVRLPQILDNLIAAKRIEPAVAVFIDYPPGVQQQETSCYPPFNEFLMKELLPFVHRRLNVTSVPARVVIGGASAGGLSAAYAALEHPEAFGAVLSQSGAFWRSPLGDVEDEWLAREFARRPRAAVRFYLSVGVLESSGPFDAGSITNLQANRHMRDVLRAKGYAVDYREVTGAHDPYNWEATLPQGLIALLPHPAAPK